MLLDLAKFWSENGPKILPSMKDDHESLIVNLLIIAFLDKLQGWEALQVK